MMNPVVKPLWTGALRSGRFPQGRGALAKQVRSGAQIEYCCWGVLCKIAVEAGVIPPPAKSLMESVLLSFDGCSALPPNSVLVWAGLERFGNDVTVNGKKNTLASHNDDLGADFLAIADGIEADL